MRTRALGIGPCTVAASLALVFATGGAHAQSTSHDAALGPAPSASPASAAEAGVAGGSRAGWVQRAATLSSLRVIELREDPLPGTRAHRPHHALTWRNDTLSRSLDDMGLNNADCRNRVRLPSRLRQSPGDGAPVQVQLQVAVSCSF